jgi:hypothetical protein
MSLLSRAALLAALAAAACGGAGQPSAHQGAVTAWREYVACVRAHGVPDMPDATVDDQGRADFPDSAPSVPGDAVRACGARVASLPTRSSPPPDVATLTRFAQCMRAQGIADWPDPTPDGRFALSRDLLDQWKGGPRWPRIEAAWHGPCSQYDPGGQLPLAS